MNGINNIINCKIMKHYRKISTSKLIQQSNKTHDVFNQSKPFINVDLYNSDKTLNRSMKKYLNKDTEQKLIDFGKRCGSIELMKASDDAEQNKPILKQFDNYGRRVDIIDYHDSYHVLMSNGINSGCSTYGFNNNTKNSHMIRMSMLIMENQMEPGHCCPITMTAAAVPVLRQVKDIIQPWYTKLLSQNYDPNNKPIEEKNGITIGMSMTEKQGGSDLKSNTTIARPQDSLKKGLGQEYLIRGHKWFTSAPMSDGFLTLSRTNDKPDQLSCFLVPRWCPNGERNNGFQVMRLKNKLADRANASSEVEYHDAWSMMIGEEGKGIKTILQMVQYTRLDCIIGATGSARRSIQLALNHTLNRSAFGNILIKQPLMENLMTDLCIATEACTLASIRMTEAFADSESGDSNANDLFRIGVAILKYYCTKLQPNLTYECMEIFGGNGFVEDFPMAKLFRHSPLNSIWEGSGNVMTLDVLRASNCLPSLFKEILLSKGMDNDFDLYVNTLQSNLKTILSQSNSLDIQRGGRYISDNLALALIGSIMLRYGHPNTTKAFIQSRIKQNHFGLNYGSFIFDKLDSQNIIENNIPIFF